MTNTTHTASDELVWAATRRAGLDFHDFDRTLSRADAGRTGCGRSTGSVSSITMTLAAAIDAGMTPCPRCWPLGLELIQAHQAEHQATEGEPAADWVDELAAAQAADEAASPAVVPDVVAYPLLIAPRPDGDLCEAMANEHAEPAPPPTADPRRAAYTTGLRELADWLDAHPEVPLPYLGTYIPGCDLPSLPIYLHQPAKWEERPDVRTQIATIARAMGTADKVTQTFHGGGEAFLIWRAFGGLAVFAQAERDEVCERVVVGQRTVTKEVPDPEALAAVPRVTVVETVDEVEWRCHPVLAAELPAGGGASS